MYQCSECSAHIGPVLDRNGKPELFRCHRTGNVAHIIPEQLIGRKPPKATLAVLELKNKGALAEKRGKEKVSKHERFVLPENRWND